MRNSLLSVSVAGWVVTQLSVGVQAANAIPKADVVQGSIQKGTGGSVAGSVIDFDEGSSLSRVLRMLALDAGLNYMDPQIDPSETIAFSLKGMSSKDAFYLVAKSRGFQVVEREGVVELVRGPKEATQDLISRSYVLKHVDSRLVLSSVANLLGITQVKAPARTSPAFPEPSVSGSATSGGASGTSSGSSSGGGSGGSGGSGSSEGANSGGGGTSLQGDGRFVPGLPMDTPLWTGGYDAARKNSIYLDRMTNALIVRASQQQHEEVERYIAGQDVMEPQIEITARVIEIDVEKLRKLGLDWALGYTTPSHKLSAGGVLASGALAATGSYNEIPSAAQAILSGWQVSALLKATESRDHSSLVTDVRVVTRSGIPAVVNNIEQEYIEVFSSTGLLSSGANPAGSTVPAGTNVSGTQSFQSGVVLDVLPRVLGDGRIDLNINPTVLTRIGQTKGASGQNLPIIVRRSTTTSVMVRDGFTVGIGGLMQVNEKRGDNRVPLLGRIPLLGPVLFGSESTERSKKNLVILVTPRLIRDGSFNGAPTSPEARGAVRGANEQLENPLPWDSLNLKRKGK